MREKYTFKVMSLTVRELLPDFSRKSLFKTKITVPLNAL